MCRILEIGVVVVFQEETLQRLVASGRLTMFIDGLELDTGQAHLIPHLRRDPESIDGYSAVTKELSLDCVGVSCPDDGERDWRFKVADTTWPEED